MSLSGIDNFSRLDENGAGKSPAAQVIYHLPYEPAAPFVKVNCAAIPKNLLEAEWSGLNRDTFHSYENQLSDSLHFTMQNWDSKKR